MGVKIELSSRNNEAPQILLLLRVKTKRIFKEWEELSEIA